MLTTIISIEFSDFSCWVFVLKYKLRYQFTMLWHYTSWYTCFFNIINCILKIYCYEPTKLDTFLSRCYELGTLWEANITKLLSQTQTTFVSNKLKLCSIIMWVFCFLKFWFKHKNYLQFKICLWICWKWIISGIFLKMSQQIYVIKVRIEILKFLL